MKAKMASRAPPKVVVAPTSSEDDEDTASGFVFTRKRGRAQATGPMPSPFRGQATSNVAPPLQPPHTLAATPCPLEAGVESSRQKGLLDQEIDVASLLRPEDEERMDAHSGQHLLQEVMKQLGQALATRCVAMKKMRHREVAIEQKKQDTQQKMVSLQQEIQSLRALH